MVVVHRISFRATALQLRRLQALGVKVPPGTVLPGGGEPLVAFDVEEDHPNWETLQQLFRQWDALDIVSTRFSKAEVETARWLRPVPDSHHGYPQPDEDSGYLQATYDLSDFCDQCGIGLKQKAPFQMTGEPRWGRKSILQMNWVFDEYFVPPEVWTTVFKPHGIACRPVTNRKGVELKTVVQVVVEEEVGIVIEGLDFERCTTCGRVKYLPFTRGFFPALTATPSRAIVKTREYFGSGAAAHKRVLVSHEVARSLLEQRVRGVWFWPVQPGGSALGR